MTPQTEIPDLMTLVATAAPLAIYAIAFQTILYVVLPSRIRTMWAPMVTGIVGAALTIGAGLIFGFETIGLGAADPGTVIGWALVTFAVTSIIGAVMLAKPQMRAQLADPRLAALSGRQAFAQIFIRIPVMTALIEEAFFRGVLHAALVALYPPSVALWAGAALFGLWHIGPGVDQAQAAKLGGVSGTVHVAITVVATTVAGAALVWLRLETGSIWASVAVHAGINMTMALFARLAARRQTTARAI